MLVFVPDVVMYRQGSHVVQCNNQPERERSPHCGPSMHPPLTSQGHMTSLLTFSRLTSMKIRDNTPHLAMGFPHVTPRTLLAFSTQNRMMAWCGTAYIALKGRNAATPHAPVGYCTRPRDYPVGTSLRPVQIIDQIIFSTDVVFQ